MGFSWSIYTFKWICPDLSHPMKICVHAKANAISRCCWDRITKIDVLYMLHITAPIFVLLSKGWNVVITFLLHIQKNRPQKYFSEWAHAYGLIFQGKEWNKFVAAIIHCSKKSSIHTFTWYLDVMRLKWLAGWRIWYNAKNDCMRIGIRTVWPFFCYYVFSRQK